jgi:hypothetical protein
MKNFLGLLLLIGMTSFIACGPGSADREAKEKAKADSAAMANKVRDSIANIETMRMNTSKQWTDLMFTYIEQTEMKKMTKEEMDILARPLKAKQDSLRALLSPEQIKELDAYFQTKGNEMVDRLLINKK